MAGPRPTVRGRLATGLRDRPAAAAVGLVVALAALRAADVLAFGLHRWPGALATSSTAAVLAAAAYLHVAGDLPGPGLRADRRALRAALLVGVAGVGAVQAAAHGLELLAVGLAGRDAGVVLAAENPATRSSAPAQVGAYLVFEVALTALGEELLFRRALLGALSRRLSFRRANAAQAALFGAWHFAWPLVLAVSPARPVVPLPVYAVGLFVVTGLVGAVFGWLVRSTGTLYTAVLAHLLHNGVAVVVHVRTPAGEPRASVLSAAVVLGYVLLAWAAWRRFGATAD